MKIIIPTSKLRVQLMLLLATSAHCAYSQSSPIRWVEVETSSYQIANNTLHEVASDDWQWNATFSQSISFYALKGYEYKVEFYVDNPYGIPSTPKVVAQDNVPRATSGVQTYTNNKTSFNGQSNLYGYSSGTPSASDLVENDDRLWDYAKISVISADTGLDLDDAFSSRLTNLSSRSDLVSGAVVNGGVVIEGQEPKWVLALASGPRLAAKSIPNTLQNPYIKLKNGAGTVICENDDWDDQQLASFSGGLVEQEMDENVIYNLLEGHGQNVEDMTTDSALLVKLEPGSYTFLIEAASGSSPNGATMISTWEGDEIASTRLTNLSSRGDLVDDPLVSNDGIVNGGLVIEGQDPKLILAMASGPRLAGRGVPNTLEDPYLKLSRVGYGLIAWNDDSDNQGSFPLGNGLVDMETNPSVIETMLELEGQNVEDMTTDSAMLILLEPGTYIFKIEAASGSDPEGATMISIWDQDEYLE